MLSDVTTFSCPHSTSRVRCHQQAESHPPPRKMRVEQTIFLRNKKISSLHKIEGL